MPLLREHHTHARSYWKHGHVQSYVHQRDQHRYWMCFAKVVVAHSLQGALAIYPSYPLVTFCGGLRTSCHHGHRSTRLCGNGPSYSWAENQRISKNQQIFFEICFFRIFKMLIFSTQLAGRTNLKIRGEQQTYIFPTNSRSTAPLSGTCLTWDLQALEAHTDTSNKSRTIKFRGSTHAADLRP